MTKRDEFDHELANFIDALLTNHCRKEGGLARVLNQFFLVADDDIGADLTRIKTAKARLEAGLSTKNLDVYVARLKLDNDMQPVWLFVIIFDFDLKYVWALDSLTLVLTERGFEVGERSFKFEGKKSVVKANDPHWGTLGNALARRKTFPA